MQNAEENNSEAKLVIGVSPIAARSKADEGSNGLGISRIIYAAGTAFKDSLILMAVIAGSLVAALTVGRKIPFVRPAAEWLLKLPENTSHLIKKVVCNIPVVGPDIIRFGAKIKDYFRANGRIVGASVGAGWAISHLILLPSGSMGYKKAQKAIDKYNDLVTENTQLKQENTRLKSDEPAADVTAPGAGFADAQKPPAASYVERAAMESPSLQSGAIGR